MAAGATTVAAVLDRLSRDGEACFGAPIEAIRTGRAIHRHFSRVVRARVTAGGADRNIYIKVFRSPAGDPTSVDRLRVRVEREFRETARAHEAFAGRDGFAPVRALALYPDLLAIVTEEVKGIPFSTLLSRGARPWSSPGALGPAARAARRAGEWLRRYQAMPSEPQPLAVSDLREYVDGRLRRLVGAGAGGFTEKLRGALLDEFDMHAARLRPFDLEAVPVHADFCPDNLLVDAGVLSVIDFAMAKRGLRYLDLSHLVIHLGFRTGLLWRSSAMRDVRAALLDGYGDAAAAESPGFRIALLVHVSALMAERLNRASRLRAAKNVWLAPQIRRCLECVHA